MLDTNIFLYELTRTILYYNFPQTMCEEKGCVVNLLNSDLINSTAKTVETLEDIEGVQELITYSQDVIEGKYKKDEILENIELISKQLKGNALFLYDYFLNLFSVTDNFKNDKVELKWT